VDRLVYETAKAICFSPEYIGEQPGHPWREESACGFVIVGGTPALCDLVAGAYSAIAGDDLKYFCSTARTAELCKYMENSFLATKVAFVNQFYDIASTLQVDFGDLLRLWLADPRIGSSHTDVTVERGFRGRCLPKDIAAIIAIMEEYGGAPLLQAVMEYNNILCNRGGSHEDLLR
jgi:UDPglucose 6-dehydrogenase